MSTRKLEVNSIANILYKNYKNFSGSIVDIVGDKIRRAATISARARIAKPNVESEIKDDTRISQ